MLATGTRMSVEGESLMTEEDNNFLTGFIEGYTTKPFAELRREHVEIRSRIAAIELMTRGNKQILLTLEQGLREAIKIEESRLNEMSKTDTRLTAIEKFIGDTLECVLLDVATQHDNLCTTVENLCTNVEKIGARLKAVEGNGNGTKLTITDVQRLPPAVGTDGRTGLEALFDKAPLYRHVCTQKGCKHHLVNRVVSGVRCNKCGYAMESHEVIPRGARGKYKPRQGAKA